MTVIFSSMSAASLIIAAAAVAVSYLIGNISPATLAGRLHGVDIRKEGSGNPGTTNVLRTLGVRAAACTLLVDVMKGALPVIAGYMLGGSVLACACGTAAFLGHIYPVFFSFKGGKGIATGFGVIVAFDLKAGLLCLAAALIGAALSRRMSVGSIAAAIILPVTFFITRPDYFIWSVCLALIVLWRHRSNIIRLIHGEEPPMSFTHKSSADSGADGEAGADKIKISEVRNGDKEEK